MPDDRKVSGEVGRTDDGRLIVIDLGCKWYLNGFPKSGLHLAVQLIRPLASAMPPGQLRAKPWAGTFSHHSWSADWDKLPLRMYQLGELRPGRYFKAHCGHLHDVEAFMWLLGVAHVFVYRDFRDVAVSQTYHIMSNNKHFQHPGRDKFLALGGKDEVLRAVIVGLDEYPGVMERWELYAPWLSVDWLFKFRFEDAIANVARMADRLVRYGLNRLGQIFEMRFGAATTSELVENMVASAGRKEEAPTYRAGRVGDWRHEFNNEHRRLFKETDKNNWLARLGYEEGPHW